LGRAVEGVDVAWVARAGQRAGEVAKGEVLFQLRADEGNAAVRHGGSFQRSIKKLWLPRRTMTKVAPANCTVPPHDSNAPSSPTTKTPSSDGSGVPNGAGRTSGRLAYGSVEP